MAIQVTCPGCLKRFSVSDKFAGKTGPCPNCQKQIKIPDKQDEVVIHAPADAGPKTVKGRSIFKPIRRTEVSLSLPVMLGIGLTVLLLLGIALGLRLSGEPPPSWLLAFTAIALAPPLAIGGYWFLHDDELESFRGRSLWIRGGVCGLAFAGLWAVYVYVPQDVSGHSSMAEISGLELAIFVPIMLAMGSAVAVAALELELAQGLLLYMLYFVSTFFLAWLAGTELAAPLAGESSAGVVRRAAPPALTAPNDPAAKPGQATPAETTPDVPKLLQ